MWFQVGTLLVALLGAAASANWLVRAHGRRVARIKGEAELLQLLPPSDARDSLAQKVETDVVSHLALTASAPARRTRRLILANLIAAALAAPVGVGPALTEVITNESVPRWMTIASVVAFTILALLALGMVFLVRAATRLREESQDEAFQEVRVSHVVRGYAAGGQYWPPRGNSTWEEYNDRLEASGEDPGADAARDILEELREATTRMKKATGEAAWRSGIKGQVEADPDSG